MTMRETTRDLGIAAGMLMRRPFSCLIQVTNRCNMKCSFCDFWPNGAPPSSELTLDDYRRLEEELWAWAASSCRSRAENRSSAPTW